MPEISQFTTLVLARIASNPNDFLPGGRFHALGDDMRRLCTDPDNKRASTEGLWAVPAGERDVLAEAYREAVLQYMTEKFVQLTFAPHAERATVDRGSVLNPMGALNPIGVSEKWVGGYTGNGTASVNSPWQSDEGYDAQLYATLAATAGRIK